MKTETEVKDRLAQLHKVIFQSKLGSKENEQKMLTISAVMRELESVLEDGAGWKNY